MSLIDDINNPLEQLKVEAALSSERMKLAYRKSTRPDQVNILDYTVIAALEKQIPKKPKDGSRVKISGIDGANCSVCGGVIFAPKNYCYKCGQAIDWSVEE